MDENENVIPQEAPEVTPNEEVVNEGETMVDREEEAPEAPAEEVQA